MLDLKCRIRDETGNYGPVRFDSGTWVKAFYAVLSLSCLLDTL